MTIVLGTSKAGDPNFRYLTIYPANDVGECFAPGLKTHW